MSVKGTRHLELSDGRAGGLVGVCDGGEGVAALVVRSARDDVVVAEIGARETPVVGAQRTVAVVEVAEVRGEARIEANITTRVAPEVAAESVQAGVELLEDDGLGLDLANLLGDDLLGHLLEDEETLLDDGDALGVADFFLRFDNSD